MSHLRRLSFSLILLASACATRSGPPPGARPAPQPEPAPAVVVAEPEAPPPAVVAETTTAVMCPPELAEAMVRVEDHDRGATLVLTSTGTPEDLRARSIAFAAAHNREHGVLATAPAEDIDQTRDQSQTGTGNQVGNSTSRGPDLEGGTEGSTGIETPDEETTDPTAIDQSTTDEQGRTLAAGTGAQTLTMSIRTASSARVEYVDSGARIVFESEDVDALRSELRELERACNAD